jgi:hypothetical protein
LKGVFFLVLEFKLGDEGQDLVPKASTNKELPPENKKVSLLEVEFVITETF